MLHTIPEVAAILSASTRTVERLLRSGDLQAVDISPSGSRRRSLRVTGESVEAFVLRRKTAAAAKNGNGNGNSTATRTTGTKRDQRRQQRLKRYERLYGNGSK